MRKMIFLSTLALLLCALAACSAVTPRRGFHRAMIDRNVQLTAQSALDDDTRLQGRAHISTAVTNGVLLLIGEAATPDVKQRAQTDVTGYEGVRKIVNLIDVMPLPSVARSMQDASITAAVKTALIQVDLPGFDPGRVNVSTAHGKVYLMGLLTHKEASAVVNVARQVVGVKEVVPVFEYTD